MLGAAVGALKLQSMIPAVLGGAGIANDKKGLPDIDPLSMIGELPSYMQSNATSSATSSVNNTFSTGNFNVGTGAGSDSFMGLIILGAVVALYLAISNR